MEPGPRTNVAVNAVRATAALLVVLFHVRIVFLVDYDDARHSPVDAALYAISSLGAQAVIVFFVLSGFWVGGSVVRQGRRCGFAWPTFLLDRWSRLWLVLLPALVLTAVLDLLGHRLYGDLSTYRGDPGYVGVVLTHPHGDGPLLFLGNALWLGGVRVDTYGSNIALWSVGYEFWMYVIGAAVVTALLVRRPWPVVVAVLALVAGGLLEPELLVYLVTWLAGAAVAAYGTGIARWLGRFPPRAVRAAQVAAALLTLGACVVARAQLGVHVGAYVVAVASALLLASLTPNLEASRPLDRYSRLANSSFSLYAIHTPLVVFLASALGVDLTHRWRSGPAGWLGVAAVVVVLAAVAWGFAQLTERHTVRVRAVLRRRLLPQRSDVAA